MISAHRLARLVQAARYEGIKKATLFIGPNEVIKATFFGKKDRRCKSESVMLTFGAPNYREREFIKKCKRAGEPFPVRKIRLQLEK